MGKGVCLPRETVLPRPPALQAPFEVCERQGTSVENVSWDWLEVLGSRLELAGVPNSPISSGLLRGCGAPRAPVRGEALPPASPLSSAFFHLAHIAKAGRMELRPAFASPDGS
jgi:hypothetical protein